MLDFRILFVEHETGRDAIADVLRTIACVKVLSDPEALREHLISQRYDLVITDAFFLAPGHDHSDYGEGVYKLDSIIRTIRDIDSFRVRIAVLTKLSPLLLQNYSDDLGSVDYLWDKGRFLYDFLVWQVSQIKKSFYEQYPSFSLVNALDAMVHSRSLPWSSEMSSMLKMYWTRSTEVDKMLAVKPYLMTIANRCKISDNFEQIIDLLISSEPFNIAGNPNAWGHLRHTINVFWLGYYFLNSGAIDHAVFAKNLYPKTCSEMNSDDVVMQNNTAWFITSIFHDVGLLGEKNNKLACRYNQMASLYSSNFLQLDSKFQFNNYRDSILTKFQNIQSSLGPSTSTYYYKAIETMERQNYIDHGILSAFMVLSYCDNFNRNNIDLAAKSIEACALHSAITKSGKDVNAKFAFNSNPLLSLLVICDQLEVWDRETNRESLFGKTKIEAGELRSITYDNENKTINGVINYIPLRYLNTNDAALFESKSSLISILDSQVLPVLNLIQFDHESPSIHFQFVFNGRDDLRSWASK